MPHRTYACRNPIPCLRLGRYVRFDWTLVVPALRRPRTRQDRIFQTAAKRQLRSRRDRLETGGLTPSSISKRLATTDNPPRASSRSHFPSKQTFVQVDAFADGLRRPAKLQQWPQRSSVRPVMNLKYKDSGSCRVGPRIETRFRSVYFKLA